MHHEVAQLPSLTAQDVRGDSLFFKKKREKLSEKAMSFISPAGLEEMAIIYAHRAFGLLKGYEWTLLTW